MARASERPLMSGRASEGEHGPQAALSQQAAVAGAVGVGAGLELGDGGGFGRRAKLGGFVAVHQDERETEALQKLVGQVGEEHEESSAVAAVRGLDLGGVAVSPAYAIVELGVAQAGVDA